MTDSKEVELSYSDNKYAIGRPKRLDQEKIAMKKILSTVSGC